MNDSEFLREFEATRISSADWTHASHLKMAYLYLRDRPYEDAVSCICKGITKLNAANGVTEALDSGFHRTMTIAWIELVRAAMRASEYSDADDFLKANPGLQNRTLIRRFYSRATLLSTEAKHEWVNPDLLPFPTKCVWRDQQENTPASLSSVKWKRDWLLASPFTMNWLLGLLLACCMFLPFAHGCNGDIVTPSDWLVQEPTSGLLELGAEISRTFWMLRPYFYGFVLSVLTVTSVVIGREKGLSFLSRGMLTWGCLAVTMLLLLHAFSYLSEDNHSKEEYWATLLIWVPPLCVVALQFYLHRKGQRWRAITAGQVGWAILAGLRFGVWWHPRTLLLGGKLSLVACIAMLEAARLQHIICKPYFDATATPRRFRFTTRYLFFLTALVAVLVVWIATPTPTP